MATSPTIKLASRPVMIVAHLALVAAIVGGHFLCSYLRTVGVLTSGAAVLAFAIVWGLAIVTAFVMAVTSVVVEQPAEKKKQNAKKKQ